MITIFTSDDAGAPVLSGQVGTLIPVLDACLINGYGAKAGMGWAKDFSGTNLAAYRAPAGNRFYLRVDDTNAQYPQFNGYRTMSGISTGTGLFPSAVQLAGGIKGVKSSTASAAARPWVIIASQQAFYLWVGFASATMGALATTTDIFFFGDYQSYMPGDSLSTAIIGRTAQDNGAAATNFGSKHGTGAVSVGHYMASDFAQSGNSEQFGTLVTPSVNSSDSGAGGGLYPDPITGGMVLDLIRIVEGGTIKRLIRGQLPGVYNPVHQWPGYHLDVLQGRGELTGHDMVILYKGGNEGRLVFSLNESDWHPVA